MAKLFANDFDSAIQLPGQALGLFQAVGHPLGMAHAHSNLARALQDAAREEEAGVQLEAARERYSELGNQLGVINVEIRLGRVYRRRDQARAIEILNKAISSSISVEARNPLAQIHALEELGEVYLANGDRQKAREAWTSALEVARGHGVTRELDRITDTMKRLGS